MGYIFLGLLITLALGVPLALCFGFATEIAVIFTDVRPSMIIPTIFQTVDSFTLMAIPFFILAGEVMKVSGISQQIVSFCDILVGRIKGSLLYVMIVACMFFGAISGSSVATVSAIGSVMVPQMTERGYDKSISASLIAAAGFIGILIPPSIPLIVYSVLAEISIARAFLSTVIPGIMLSVSYMFIIRFYYIRKGFFNNVDRSDLSVTLIQNLKDNLRSILQGIPALVMPIIILGGIYGGIFTPTESAAVATAYAIVVGFLYYRGLKFSNIGDTITKAALNSSAIMFVMAFVSIFGRILLVDGLPDRIARFILSVTDNKIIIILMINMFLLLVGMFIEENAAILILTPIMLPLIIQIGINPIQFGAIIVMNLGIGLITPPHASNIFVANKVTGVPILDMLPHLMRFILFGALPCVLLISYIPALTLWLPSVLMP